MAENQDYNAPAEEPKDDVAGDEDQKKQVKRWQNRLNASNKRYAEWEDDFQCEKLEDYYAGKQAPPSAIGTDYYVLNNFFPAVEVRLPSIMFGRPRVQVQVIPAKADDIGSKLDERAKVIEDIANHFIMKRGVGFRPETLAAAKESMYRFGVIEVGYSANPIDNPNAGKPVLDEKNGALVDEKGPVLQPNTLVEDEAIFVKRIPAKNFRYPVHSHNILERNDWVAYYEWVYPSDVKQNKFYNAQAVAELTAPGGEDLQHPDGDEDTLRRERRPGMIKLWRVWDLRANVKRVFIEDKCYFLEEEEFKYCPLAVLKFHELLDSGLPLPYLANGVSPQDEMNESRNMLRGHRRRFVRRYAARKGAIDNSEVEKLTGVPIDGQIIWENSGGSLRPIEDANLGTATMSAVPQSQDDFRRILGIGGEAQGIADSDTATQASIIDTGMKSRETFAREIVADWLNKIIWLIIRTARDRMTMPWLIQTQVDPMNPQAPIEIQRLGMLWQEIQAPEIGDLEFEIQVDVESLAPVTEDRRREQWNQVLSLFSNPIIMQVFLVSDVILRKTLSFYGIKADRDIAEIKNSMMALVTNQIQQAIMAQANAASAQPTAGGTPGGPAPQPGPPGAEQQANALTGQMAAPTAP